MTLTLPLLLTFIVLCLFSRLVYQRIIYPAFLSPLSKIPSAHPTSSILPIWIWWKCYTGCESRSIFAAHQRLGSVVLLAPNEVSINSREGVKEIYGGGFYRTESFGKFGSFGAQNLITLRGGKKHAAQRRMLANVYSKSFILDSPHFHNLSRIILSERLFPILDAAARKGQAVDAFEMSSAVSVEFMGAYGLGIDNSYDFLGDEKADERKRHVENGLRRVMTLDLLATRSLEDEFFEMCMKAEAAVSLSSTSEDEKEATYPVVYAQLRGAMLRNNKNLDPEELRRLVACEIFDHVEAARAALAITIIYVIHHLSQRPATQSALRKELATLNPPMTLPFGEATRLSTASLQSLDRLELLHGIIMETLRVNPATPGPQRRVVPKGGTVIEEYFIPEGTTVSSSAWCMHRNEAAFPNPEEWRPDRWMKNDLSSNTAAAADDDPRRWFWAFGSGGKMCIGNHFSMIVIKLLVAAIYANFSTNVIDDKGIEQTDNFLAFPKATKLMIGFHQLDTE